MTDQTPEQAPEQAPEQVPDTPETAPVEPIPLSDEEVAQRDALLKQRATSPLNQIDLGGAQ